MPHLLKPAFEQFRHEAIVAGKPMLEKNIVPIQAEIVSRLESLNDLLIEKTRRLPHPEGMIEISAKWFGLNSDQREVVRQLRQQWTDEVMGAAEVAVTILPSEEAVLMMFAGKYADGRYLTGRMLVSF